MVPRAVGGGDLHHAYYPGDRELLGAGRGGGREAAAHRMHSDIPPPAGGRLSVAAATAAAAAAAAGTHPYAARERDRPTDGDRGGGGGEGLRSPPAHPSRVHSSAAPSDRDPPQRYGGPVPTINRAMLEAVDRIVQRSEQRGAGGGGGGGVVSPVAAATVAGPQTAVAGTGVERVGHREGGGGGVGDPPLSDAKEAAMRLCSLLDSFDGRVEEVMEDVRARAELESIFPGLEERDFRSMLGGFMDRYEVSLLFLLRRAGFSAAPDCTTSMILL